MSKNPSKNPSLTISHDLVALGKYPNMEPKSVSLFHHCLNGLSGPPAEASSAYQTCLHPLFVLLEKRPGS